MGTLAAMAVGALSPRVLDVDGAAQYLGGICWTGRDLMAAGRLRRVRLPGAGSADLRKVLLDVRDLDAMIEGSKDSGS